MARRGLRRVGRTLRRVVAGALVALTAGGRLIAQEDPGPSPTTLHGHAVELARRAELGPGPEAARAALRELYHDLTVRRATGRFDDDESWALCQAAFAQRKGEPEPAVLDVARDVARVSADPELVGWVEFEVARRLVGAGRLDEAEHTLQRAIEAAPDTPARFLQAHLLAELARKQGRYAEALARLDRLAGYAAVLDATYALTDVQVARYGAAVHGARGQVYRWMGLPERAVAESRLEREAALASGAPDVLGAWAVHHADILLYREHWERVAEHVLECSEEPWFAHVSSAARMSLRLALGLALLEREREVGGADAGGAAANVLIDVAASDDAHAVDRMLAEINLAELRIRAGDVGGAASALDSARGRVGPHQRDLLETALLETQRGRLALARNEERETLAACLEAVRGAYDDLLERWAATEVRPGGVGFLGVADRREIVATLVRLVLRLHDREDGLREAVAEVLRAEARGSIARRLGLSAVSLREVREELLGARDVALVYLIGKTESHLFVVDDALTHLLLPGEDELRRSVEPLMRELGRPLASEAADRDGYRSMLRAGGRLACRALLPDAALWRVVAKDGVTVVGLDALGNPPLGMLPDPSGPDGALLGTRLAIARVPSLAFALHLARRAGAETARDREDDVDLLLLANPRSSPAARALSPDAVPMDLDETDLRALTAPFGSRAHARMDAAPASLVSAAAEGAAILHVVCHGVYDDSRERGALLALAPAPGDDGLVDCEEVEVMPGTARLVILSACGAARGPRRVGDDALTHLGGAFLEAGARAVVVSARPVELRATTRLMVAFHRALARGAPTAAALRDARRELASDADPLDAFHLAQFEVLGLGSAPVLR